MQGLLRSVWEEPAATDPPKRAWWDWALVGALVPAAIAEGVLRPELPWRITSAVVTVALVPTLLWRRTRPLSMVATGFIGCGLLTVLTRGSLDMRTLAYLLILPYSLIRWGSGRSAVLGSAIVLANIVLSAALGPPGIGDAVGGTIVLGAVMALGAAFRYRARARQREFDQVKLLERESLARDLHDTVAHHVSAMAIRAQAGLATASTNPDAAAEALRVIEAEASRALAEMRAMVRVLRRSGPAELAPSPGIGDLARLADPSGSGPAVSVEIAGDVGAVPAPVAGAVYQLARESVTNARRHARNATHIDVSVAIDDTSVRLHVRDDGEATPRTGRSFGYGLAGMAERASLLGGVCDAGPGPGRGWTVTAVLPHTGAAA